MLSASLMGSSSRPKEMGSSTSLLHASRSSRHSLRSSLKASLSINFPSKDFCLCSSLTRATLRSEVSLWTVEVTVRWSCLSAVCPTAWPCSWTDAMVSLRDESSSRVACQDKKVTKYLFTLFTTGAPVSFLYTSFSLESYFYQYLHICLPL